MLATEAEVLELEEDTYGGKRLPLESAAPAPLHTQPPGAYVPQVPHLLLVRLGVQTVLSCW